MHPIRTLEVFSGIRPFTLWSKKVRFTSRENSPIPIPFFVISPPPPFQGANSGKLLNDIIASHLLMKRKENGV